MQFQWFGLGLGALVETLALDITEKYFRQISIALDMILGETFPICFEIPFSLPVPVNIPFLEFMAKVESL